MSVLEILKYPDPFLKTKAIAVETIDDSIKTLIADMTETMYDARGIGLAAVQVGVGKRVVVLDVPDEPKEGDPEDKPPQRGKNLIALVNPEITERAGETRFDEGCLSVPGETAEVVRSETVRVKALNQKGQAIEFTATGLFAIAIQHELDHLEGVLFIDRLSRLKREFIKRRLKKALEAHGKAL